MRASRPARPPPTSGRCSARLALLAAGPRPRQSPRSRQSRCPPEEAGCWAARRPPRPAAARPRRSTSRRARPVRCFQSPEPRPHRPWRLARRDSTPQAPGRGGPTAPRSLLRRGPSGPRGPRRGARSRCQSPAPQRAQLGPHEAPRAASSAATAEVPASPAPPPPPCATPPATRRDPRDRRRTAGCSGRGRASGGRPQPPRRPPPSCPRAAGARPSRRWARHPPGAPRRQLPTECESRRRPAPGPLGWPPAARGGAARSSVRSEPWAGASAAGTGAPWHWSRRIRRRRPWSRPRGEAAPSSSQASGVRGRREPSSAS
mmetsp:Transcript_73383/g.215200  ORF Transcript_73383/g.215200 Transcript_73383/m.215200 type:complete len:317 (-) Transcript_73383:92-1042(-)